MNIECKKSSKNLFNILPVQSAKETLLNTVARDVFNRIGSKSINSNVLDSYRKQEIQFYLQMFKGLKNQLHL